MRKHQYAADVESEPVTPFDRFNPDFMRSLVRPLLHHGLVRIQIDRAFIRALEQEIEATLLQSLVVRD